MDEKRIEPMPERFASYEAAAGFWDNHDTTDYLEEFRPVEVVSALRTRHYEVERDESIAKALQAQARQQGITSSRLASDLLRERLGLAA